MKQKEENVEVVLIDKFIVPEESKATFLTEVRRSSAYLRTLPGFVEGYVNENPDGHRAPCGGAWVEMPSCIEEMPFRAASRTYAGAWIETALSC